MLDDLSTGRRANLAVVEGDEPVCSSSKARCSTRRLVEPPGRRRATSSTTWPRRSASIGCCAIRCARSRRTSRAPSTCCARARRRRRAARADRLDLRGVRQERQGRARRGRRPGARLGAPVALVLRLGQGDRRSLRAGLLGRSAACPSTVVRLFNTVGPRQTGRYGMVVPRFVRWALQQRAAARLRRRPADALLHQRARRRARAGRADGHAARARARSSTSASRTRSASSTWRGA